MSFSIPKTYKAAAILSPGGNFEIIEKPLELPQEGTVLVKVLACGVCASDAMVKYGMTPLPRTPGHEIVGDVVAVPAGETRWKVGDRIGSGWHGGHCHKCSSCAEYDFVTCSEQAINGITQDGGFAEYVTLRAEAVAYVPTDLDPAEAAPLFCAGVTTFNSLRHVQGLKKGDLVAVHGLGGLGHLGVQYAKQMGFKVVALSQFGSKKELAMKLGADIYLDASKVNQVEELQKLGGAKVILATAPNGEAITTLLGGLRAGGTMLTVAVAELKVNSITLISRHLSTIGFPAGDAKDSIEAIEFARQNNIKTMVERFPLEKVNEAYDRMKSGEVNFRVVLIPN